MSLATPRPRRRERIPKLVFSDHRGIGWHVSQRGGLPRMLVPHQHGRGVVHQQ